MVSTHVACFVEGRGDEGLDGRHAGSGGGGCFALLEAWMRPNGGRGRAVALLDQELPTRSFFFF